MFRLITTIALLFTIACGNDEPAPQPPPAATTGEVEPVDCSTGPGELFEQRIAPLLSQDRPSSCSKCHGAGVDLAAFVTGDACGSMACLVEQGMVDLGSPTDSQLLTFISRGFDPEPNTGVTDEMVATEYDGFLQWIEWTAQCQDACPQIGAQQCNVAPTPTEPEPEPEPEPPALNLDNYPCNVEAQARAFRDHAFPSQGRCGHCHAVNGAIAGAGDAPTWIASRQTVEGAMRTMHSLYALGAINLESPSKSNLVRKPLHEDYGGIEHAGGSKFRDTDDELYVAMVTWITMQAQCDLFRGTPHPEMPEPDKLRDRYPGLPYVP